MDGLSVLPLPRRATNWSPGIQPLDFDADYYSTLEWYNIPDDLRVDCLDCAHDAILDGTDASDIRPFHLRTGDLDRFKSWIGMPDDYVRAGKAIGPEFEALTPFDSRLAHPDAELSPDERQDVFLAAGAYLFGDSATVAEYRRAIELRMAPFEIAVYAARRVILRPTGSLTISGPPSVLIAGRIDLQAGTMLRSKTVARILSDHLVKTEAQTWGHSTQGGQTMAQETAQNITVTPSNSPYTVPSPSVTYGSVTIQPGGFLVFPQPTTMTCDSLVKSTQLAE